MGKHENGHPQLLTLIGENKEEIIKLMTNIQLDTRITRLKERASRLDRHR